MNTGRWLFWGFVATLVLTSILSASQSLRLTRMNLPYLLGALFTADRDRARIAGFFVHLLDGWLFSLLYVGAFEQLQLATWWFGAFIGLLHALFVLTVGMQLVPAMHPRMVGDRRGPTLARQLEPPGFLALHYGRRTPISVVVAHVIFGAILGVGYRVG